MSARFLAVMLGIIAFAIIWIWLLAKLGEPQSSWIVSFFR